MTDGQPDNAVELKDIWFSYSGKSLDLKGVSLTVKPSTSTMLVGPNGSGKTTLIKMINGLLKPDRGSVKILGIDIQNEAQRRMIRRRIGYIPQQLGLVRSSTVLKNVLIGALSRMRPVEALLGLYPEYEIEYAWSCIDMVGMTKKLNEKVYRLSGGQRQRVAIARALMQKPTIILADEFTSDLDYTTTRDVMNIMGEVKKQGVTIVVSTHNLELAADYGETVVCMNNGVKVAEMEAAGLTEETMRMILR